MTWPPSTPAGPAYVYRATCHRVVDGDTFEADVDLGFTASVRIMVRLHGVNAPEHNTPEGPAATAYLKVLLLGAAGSAPTDLLLSSLRGDRSFARWVCDVWADGALVAQDILDSGHGVPLMQ